MKTGASPREEFIHLKYEDCLQDKQEMEELVWQ